MASLAELTRLRLLRLLERHELGVVELCDVLQLPQSTVSRHLKVLADQKWVRGRREATTRLYRMILDELEPAARKLWLLARDQSDGWAAVKQDALRLERVLRQRQTDSQSFFAGAAAEWDSLRRSLYGSQFSTAALLALLPAEWVVADLGCGTGELSAALGPHVKRVIGVDNSAAMLKAASRRAMGLKNVDLRRGDMAALPIESSSCDAALAVLALTYVADVAAAVREAVRILRPGGKLVIVDLLPHDRDDFRRQMGQVSAGLEPAALQRIAEQAGLGNAAVCELPSEAQVKGPALFMLAVDKVGLIG
jgi:ubiquinone/menaquinone biosynthesis C-methylase UbiE/DNA-binding transcriptional ArsR family regulator